MTRCFRARLSRTTEAEYPLEGQVLCGLRLPGGTSDDDRTILADTDGNTGGLNLDRDARDGLASLIARAAGVSTRTEKSPIRVSRLKRAEHDPARTLFAAMAEIFEQPYVPLSDAYVDRLLAREDFWALAASVDDRIVGGLTAHTLPMTRSLAREIFIYDIAVLKDHQRQGIGRLLVTELRQRAAAEGIDILFVSADNADAHALDFYRALGGTASSVTFFTFESQSR
jgi:aminoglycoside 3-N-acetyltransferase I